MVPGFLSLTLSLSSPKPTNARLWLVWGHERDSYVNSPEGKSRTRPQPWHSPSRSWTPALGANSRPAPHPGHSQHQTAEPEPSPRRAGGVAHLCIPSARTRDTRSIFVGKFVKEQVPPPSLSDSLCLEVSGTRARSQIPPRRGWGMHGPSCVLRSPQPSQSTSVGVWDPGFLLCPHLSGTPTSQRWRIGATAGRMLPGWLISTRGGRSGAGRGLPVPTRNKGDSAELGVGAVQPPFQTRNLNSYLGRPGWAGPHCRPVLQATNPNGHTCRAYAGLGGSQARGPCPEEFRSAGETDTAEKRRSGGRGLCLQNVGRGSHSGMKQALSAPPPCTQQAE